MKYYDTNFVLEILKYLTNKPVNMRTLDRMLELLINEVKKQAEEQQEEKSLKEADESMDQLNKSMTEKYIKEEVERRIKELRKKK